jgi:hypothetical protein
MSMYLQLGHESWHLLDEPQLGAFTGVVLSPVNDSPTYVTERLDRLKDRRADLEVILDPQLYNPANFKGTLGDWLYFPSDFESATREDVRWWQGVASAIVRNAGGVGADTVCSPAFVPKTFSDGYFELVVAIADQMKREATDRGLATMLTAIVPIKDLLDRSRGPAIASILSGSDCDRVYLVFLDDTPPREPYKDPDALSEAMRLVNMLSRDMRIHIAFSGLDQVLWRYAGAQDVSTGKWLNTRRFAPGRWQDEETGGRVVPYWTDGEFIALLRDADVLRLDREGLLAGETLAMNPFSLEILEILRKGSGEAWLRLSQLQYLKWAHFAHDSLSGAGKARAYLERADRRWATAQDKRIFFSDRFNEDPAVRAWLHACRVVGLG